MLRGTGLTLAFTSLCRFLSVAASRFLSIFFRCSSVKFAYVVLDDNVVMPDLLTLMTASELSNFSWSNCNVLSVLPPIDLSSTSARSTLDFMSLNGNQLIRQKQYRTAMLIQLDSM